MKKLLSTFLILFVSALATAEEHQSLLFNPVMGVPSRTTKQWGVTFQRSPLNNTNTSFLANSLSVGVTDRFELGTSPTWYGVSAHEGNFQLKYNFWRSDSIDWAYSQGHIRYKLDAANEVFYYNLAAAMISSSLHPPEWDSHLGFFATLIQSTIEFENPSYNSPLKHLKYQVEYGMDWQIPMRRDQWLTLGVGKQRDMGLTTYEDLSDGAGLAYTWYLPRKLISRPSLAYYTNRAGNTHWSFTTTFYEN